MEVRPGYKHTDVGVIPEDWDIRSVDQIGDIKTGPFGTLLKASEYSGNDGVPLISVGEVGDGTFRVTEDTPRVPQRVVRRLPQYVLRTGDIVFGRKGAVERSALVSQRENGWFLGSDGISVRPLSSCYPPYLAAQFRSYSVRSWLAQNAIGTTMASLNQGILRRVLVPYAPIPEQRAIATALSDVDALLGGLDLLIAKKRDLKQAAMQQLLTGQTRLPGFHGEWEVKRLGVLAEIVSGGTPRTTEPAYWNGGIKWCTPTDITGCAGKHLNETERTISQLGLQNSGASLLPAGALLLCSRATIGEVKVAAGEICTNQGFKSLVCLPGMSNEFLYYKLLTMKQQMVGRAFGSTFLEISKANLAALEINAPPPAEQTAIAAVLSDMDAELAALEARRNKTRALKQGMMQELLTGRTRLV